ncbi:MAG: M48 family metallopeptidase [candidate division KSB1 bacterium]|nr:M48 family metallopeptidase [candidate division KSB1 bacterium]
MREYCTVIGHRAVRFMLKRGKRANVRLTVHGDKGLVVVAGRRIPLREIETVLRSQANWIHRRLLELDRVRKELTTPDGMPRTLVRGQWVLTKPCLQTRRCALRDGVLEVPLRTDPRPALIAWYRTQARAEFEALSRDLASRLGVSIGRLQIRGQRTRWGSYSRSGTLSLNWKLLMAPPPVYRYVVVHELAHAHYMDHSQRFWRLVEAHCPHFREAIRWLRKHSLLIEALSAFRHVTVP